MAAGTEDDPWNLTTAPGSSAYTMYRDEGDPPLPVCQVGSTRLTYLARAVEDLHSWLPACTCRHCSRRSGSPSSPMKRATTR